MRIPLVHTLKFPNWVDPILKVVVDVRNPLRLKLVCPEIGICVKSCKRVGRIEVRLLR